MLEIEHLHFRHPGAAIDYAFSLTVDAGQVVGLSGPSGSGKSTLLDLVAGFLAPGAGDIRLDGRSLLSLPPEDRPVSLLFQADNLFEHLSVATNVALGLGGRPARHAEAVARALHQMGLDGFDARRAATLSGGQKQRVALARTLLRNKPVLLLDEPFSGLDPETAAPIRTLIRQLVRQEGWHTILVSHQGEDIEAMADHRFRLGEGAIIPV